MKMLSLLILVVTGLACDTRPVTPSTPEERARAAEETRPGRRVDVPGSRVAIGDNPRARRDALLEDLYNSYGGGDTARNLRKETARTTETLGKQVTEGVSDAATKADRAAFNARCESVGKGQEPLWTADERTKSFFAQTAVRDRCAEVVRLNREIDDQDRARR